LRPRSEGATREKSRKSPFRAKLGLNLDETALQLTYITHEVTVTGKNLGQIYVATSGAEARLVRVAPPGYSGDGKLSSKQPLVREIRINPMDPQERRKQ
jgi:hypothetical protein